MPDEKTNSNHELIENYDDVTWLYNWWPMVKSNFRNLLNWVTAHINGTGDRHNAADIDYNSGTVEDGLITLSNVIEIGLSELADADAENCKYTIHQSYDVDISKVGSGNNVLYITIDGVTSYSQMSGKAVAINTGIYQCTFSSPSPVYVNVNGLGNKALRRPLPYDYADYDTKQYYTDKYCYGEIGRHQTLIVYYDGSNFILTNVAVPTKATKAIELESTDDSSYTTPKAVGVIAGKVKDDIGDLSELNTEDKTSVVNAINAIVSPKNDEAINLWIQNGQLGWDSYDLVDNEGHIFEERLVHGVYDIVDAAYVNSKIDFDNIVPENNSSSTIGTQTTPYGNITARRVFLQNTNGIETGSSGILIYGDPVDVLLHTSALDIELGDDYRIRDHISEISSNVGDPSALSTSDKTSVVGAINEIVSEIVGASAEYQLRFGDGSAPESDVMTETYEDGTTTYTGFNKYFAQPSSNTDWLHLGTGIDVYKVEGMELTKIASSIDDDNINLTIQGLESACYGSGTFNELAIETYLMKADTYNYRANGFNLEGVNTLQTTDDNPVVETEDYIYVRLGTMKITDYYSEDVDYKYEITFTPNADVFGESESGNASAAIGDDTNYGIVKLNDSVNSTNDASDGTAATPAAVKAVYDAMPKTFFPTATMETVNGFYTATVTIDNFPASPPSGTKIILNNRLTFEGSQTIKLSVNGNDYTIMKSALDQFYTDSFSAIYPTFTYIDGQFILTSFIPAISYSGDNFFGLCYPQQ